MTVETAWVEPTATGWKAIILVNKKRAILSEHKKKEKLIRFLAQAGYRIVEESNG